MKANKIACLAQRMQRLKEQLRDAQQERDRQESRRAFRAMRRAGLTAVDVERLFAQMANTSGKEVSDDRADHRQAE
ncbi:MAG: hypothetical protein M0P72_06585 [Metallibacterium scheffleri]|jgi:hypothetical protein|uniref:hypothetical protein n=1 Tax=Metallibacterium scheffleri TaxID=993689 RepID=UPI0026F2C51E|nr:hypothetical protein [Metallibacterium scheffleri]MCK9366798.1 hypothetical protein [Metallibacterium scheffleri]